MPEASELASPNHRGLSAMITRFSALSAHQVATALGLPRIVAAILPTAEVHAIRSSRGRHPGFGIGKIASQPTQAFQAHFVIDIGFDASTSQPADVPPGVCRRDGFIVT